MTGGTIGRIAIAAGFAVIGAVIVTTPDSDVPSFVRHNLGYVVVAILAVAAVLEAVESIADRRAKRAEKPSNTTGIQLLDRPEVEYDGPATIHYPEGGDR